MSPSVDVHGRSPWSRRLVFDTAFLARPKQRGGEMMISSFAASRASFFNAGSNAPLESK
jgi:hypothetical protein